MQVHLSTFSHEPQKLALRGAGQCPRVPNRLQDIYAPKPIPVKGLHSQPGDTDHATPVETRRHATYPDRNVVCIKCDAWTV